MFQDLITHPAAPGSGRAAQLTKERWLHTIGSCLKVAAQRGHAQILALCWAPQRLPPPHCQGAQIAGKSSSLPAICTLALCTTLKYVLHYLR